MMGKFSRRKLSILTWCGLLCWLLSGCEPTGDSAGGHAAKSTVLTETPATLFSAGRYEEVDRMLLATELRGDTSSAICDLRAVNLAGWAEHSAHVQDSVTMVRCLLELAGLPLPDSVLTRVCPLVDLEYRTRAITDNIMADYAPRFFPDGRKIAFFSRVEREGLEHLSRTLNIRYQTQIYTMDISSGQTEVISDGRASEFFPDVSPDGNFIVCQRAEGDTLKGEWTAAQGSYLYLYELNTGVGRPLGRDTLRGQCPRFCPSGKEIVFITGCFGEEGWITSFDLATEELTSRYRYENILHSGKPGGVFCPSLLSGGKGMVFQAGILNYKGVYVADEFGRNLKRLAQRKHEWNDDVREWHPTVSPDGKRIVFIADTRDGEELFFSNIDGTGRRRITFDGYDKMFPAYSPDGRYIAYGAKEQGRPGADYEIYMLDLAAPAYREQIGRWAREKARKMGIPIPQ